MERLQKFIANSGYCSRRKAEELITAGSVMVNGKTVKELGTKVDNRDIVTVEGKKLNIERKEYYLLNKPRNVVSSVSDDKNRECVVDLINTKSRIYPVGRLDYDTTGLLLLTNDGELTNILMHPSNEVVKTYVVKLEGVLDMSSYFKIKKGILIEGTKIVPKRLKIKSKDEVKNTSIIEISIVEGLNHIVKNIFKAVGYEVIKLKRESYGFLYLGNLKSGEYRNLTREEIDKLYKYKK